MAGRVKETLTDGSVEAKAEFGTYGTWWDLKVPGLQVRIGKRKVTWAYCAEYRIKGRTERPRGTTFRRLGFFPSMGIAEARKAALVMAGQRAGGRLMPGRRDALTLADALTEYDKHLRAQAAKRGKKPTWAALVGSLTRKHLLPILGNFSLIELSNAPTIVRDWHADVSKTSPVSANRCASVLSAAYRYAARLDRSLPVPNPCSAVRYNQEQPKQSAMPFEMFAAWESAVAALPPIRQSFYRFCLLTGARSGEAARIKWTDVDCKSRSITIKQAKAGLDVVIPMSAAIARTLKMARGAGADQERVFPNAKNWDDDLPAKGHALRHSYRSVAADLGINEVLVRLLMGHSLVGINQSYITKLVLTTGPGLRAAQATISKRIVELLKLT